MSKTTSNVIKKYDKAEGIIKKGDDISDALPVVNKTNKSSLVNATNRISNANNISKGNDLLNKATNPKLKNTIQEMYRPGAKIGDGGLSDAIRYEMKTGNLVGGKSHIQKGKERMKNLENILNKQDLNSTDKKIVTELINDLKKSLEGK